MRHLKEGRKLSRTASHRKALLRNLTTALFEHERIETTLEKAKEARRVAERMITHAKHGKLHSRRFVARTVQDPVVVRKLFDDSGDGNVCLIHQVQCLTDRVLITEIATGSTLRHDDIGRSGQRCCGVATNKG